MLQKTRRNSQTSFVSCKSQTANFAILPNLITFHSTRNVKILRISKDKLPREKEKTIYDSLEASSKKISFNIRSFHENGKAFFKLFFSTFHGNEQNFYSKKKKKKKKRRKNIMRLCGKMNLHKRCFAFTQRDFQSTKAERSHDEVV